MRYAFLNNFTQELAASLGETETLLEVDDNGALMGNASDNLIYTLTLFDETSGENEIVHVTAAGGNYLTVVRGQEGTTALAWPTGTQVEMRLTAGILGSVVQVLGGTASDDKALSIGEASTADSPGAIAIGPSSQSSAPGAFAIGPSSQSSAPNAFAAAGGSAYGDDSVAIGGGSEVYEERALAVAGGYANGVDSVAIGVGAEAREVRALAAVGGYANGVDSVAIGVDAKTYAASSLALMGGYTSGGTGQVAIGSDSNASGSSCLALMGGDASGDGSMVFGAYASASGLGALALMANADAYGDQAVVIGDSAEGDTEAVAIGASAYAGGDVSMGGGIAIGGQANAGAGCVVMGAGAAAQAPSGIAIGSGAASQSPENAALGAGAAANPPYSVALGPYANTTIEGGLQINALSYLPATPDDTGEYAGPPSSSTRRASQQAVIATDPLDLTDDTAAVTLDLPTDTMLFIDSIDVVVTGSDTPGGSPEIVVGPDDVTPASYLAATPVTKTTVGGREVHSPIVADGVTALRVATSTAGTGTTYQAKIVFRGYVMEV